MPNRNSSCSKRNQFGINRKDSGGLYEEYNSMRKIPPRGKRPLRQVPHLYISNFFYAQALMWVHEVFIDKHRVCVGNSMVSSAIWKKHARVSFSKTIKIARVQRTSEI